MRHGYRMLDPAGQIAKWNSDQSILSGDQEFFSPDGLVVDRNRYLRASCGLSRAQVEPVTLRRRVRVGDRCAVGSRVAYRATREVPPGFGAPPNAVGEVG